MKYQDAAEELKTGNETKSRFRRQNLNMTTNTEIYSTVIIPNSQQNDCERRFTIMIKPPNTNISSTELQFECERINKEFLLILGFGFLFLFLVFSIIGCACQCNKYLKKVR